MKAPATLSAPLGNFLPDPRFWAGLLFLAGLYWLDLPYYDDHSARQAGTATIARNFYKFGLNPLYPMSDICGEHSPDYFATEFPFLQTLSVPLYHLFGEQYWIGRLVNWTVSCLGLVCFARIVDRIFDKPVGLYAMLGVVGSVTLMFMRKMMPDTFSLFLAVIGTYYLYRYLEEGRGRQLILGGVIVTLGVLSKIPSLMVLTLLSTPFLFKTIPLRRKIRVFSVLLVAGCCTACWYFYWMGYLQDINRCPPLIFPVSLSEGFQTFFFEHWRNAYTRFTKIAFFGPWPLVLFLIGVVYSAWKRQWPLLLGAAVYTVLLLLFAFKTGHVFPTHNYYVIPYIPLMALFAAQLFHQRWLPWWGALLIILAGIYEPVRKNGKDIYLRYDPLEVELYRLLDEAGSDPDAHIMINGRQIDPTLMYYSKRKGWAITNETLEKYHWMPDYRAAGLKHLVVDRRRYDKPLRYRVAAENRLFRVYDVSVTLPEGKVKGE